MTAAPPRAAARMLDGSGPLDGSPCADLSAASRHPGPAAGPAPPPVDTPPAFEAVYALHFTFVWQSLRALGVRAAAIDDATQDVFIVVHDRLHTFDGRRPLRAWLYGIARNMARRHHEQAQRRSPLQLVSSPAPLDETVQWRERAAVVARFLDELDEGHRAVFVLAQLEGATAPEIAESLGLNLNTVYSRLRTTRARFERVLARDALRDRSHPDV